MISASAAPVSQSYGSNACESEDLRIPPSGLIGSLRIPKKAFALVVFAHGSGSSRLSPRNVAVARALNDRRIATLLFDLLTPAEEVDRANVFDIRLLAGRLVDVILWLDGQPSVAKLPLGLFGASTGAAAALLAAARLPLRVGAVVSRGGLLLYRFLVLTRIFDTKACCTSAYWASRNLSVIIRPGSGCRRCRGGDGAG